MRIHLNIYDKQVLGVVYCCVHNNHGKFRVLGV